MGFSFPRLLQGWLGARRACCGPPWPHHWPGTVGEPDPEVPPPSLQSPQSEPPGALGLPVPRRSGRPRARPGTHACPASPPQGPGPRGGCPPPLPAPGGCPVAAGSQLSRCTRGWAPALPALRAPQGQGPPVHRLTSSSGSSRGYGTWWVPGPPDLCPLPRWRPRSLRTWWSTTRAPGTPACWLQTVSCPSCSASLTAASTAWPSSQVPSRGPLSPAGSRAWGGWCRCPKGHIPDWPLLSSLSPEPRVCWGSRG